MTVLVNLQQLYNWMKQEKTIEAIKKIFVAESIIQDKELSHVDFKEIFSNIVKNVCIRFSIVGNTVALSFILQSLNIIIQALIDDFEKRDENVKSIVDKLDEAIVK